MFPKSPEIENILFLIMSVLLLHSWWRLYRRRLPKSPEDFRRKRTPAMALGLTDYIRDVGDILRKPLIAAMWLASEYAEKLKRN